MCCRPLAKLKAKGHPQIVIRHASQLVSMDESPAQALRVKKGFLDASGDQSGQAGRGRRLRQRRQHRRADGDRPLRAQDPARYRSPRHLHHAADRARPDPVLDLGANVDSKAEHLLQFAVMGSVLATVNGHRTAARRLC
jgi:glycerol-3-phosphate acyltransferase PlsX